MKATIIALCERANDLKVRNHAADAAGAYKTAFALEPSDGDDTVR